MNNKKPLLIVLIALGVLVALVALAVLGVIGYFRLSVAQYYAASEKTFVIPDIKNDYVPQGMHYCPEDEVFLLSGYSASGQPSPLYVIDATGKKVGKDMHPLQKVTLQNADGTPFLGHGGGIARYGDYVYVTGDDARLYIFSYAEIMAAKHSGSVRAKGEFSLQAGDDYVIPAFVTVHDGMLTVGEFYREEVYPTPESHHMTTKAGDVHYAIAVTFALSEQAEYGIDPTPLAAYSLPAQVQGMTYDGESIYLSTSWGLSFSHILEYDAKALAHQGEMTVLGKTVPLYAMDSASLVKDHKIAPMSEEMAVLDGKLYVLSESASDKYIFGRLIGGKWCYATDMEKMK